MILPTLTILIGLPILGFGIAFLSAPLNLNSVYGSVTPEQEELGTNEDGDKKSYTDCDGYKEFTESKGISKEDADYNTDAVDQRIQELQSKGVDINKYEIEEFQCLEAIRAIENQALDNMGGIAQDLQELGDLYRDQADVNERFESLKEKYGE